MKLKIFSLLIILCPLIFSCRQHEFTLRQGDIIFQESGVSQMENSIREVTNSIEGYDFTHVGIVCEDPEGNFFVLEAVPPIVAATPLERYLYPDGRGGNNPRSVAARLKPEYRNLIPAAIEEGHRLVGAEYDYAYTLGDDKYYCSEYIYEMLKRANAGNEIFSLNSMTFRSPETGEITDGWLKYYERLGMPVPEGEPGINPGAMSRSDVIEIVYFYGE